MRLTKRKAPAYSRGYVAVANLAIRNQHRLGQAERLTFVSGAKRKGSTQTLSSVASCRSLQCNVGMSGFIVLKNALMTSAARMRCAGFGILLIMTASSVCNFSAGLGIGGFIFILSLE
jgi:hypothetical protein